MYESTTKKYGIMHFTFCSTFSYTKKHTQSSLKLKVWTILSTLNISRWDEEAPDVFFKGQSVTSQPSLYYTRTRQCILEQLWHNLTRNIGLTFGLSLRSVFLPFYSLKQHGIFVFFCREDKRAKCEYLIFFLIKCGNVFRYEKLIVGDRIPSFSIRLN